ncbi:hypothetical protein EYC80_000487 [Monilinia laxa]|uniref:Uncharacterized protein n=1 Tax=Monilinia laxa TaxID=61186 RepID=A0A5N6KAS1_MONLA|nr:hypothetical protein EYC80_000487 [Monilinia laxa]
MHFLVHTSFYQPSTPYRSRLSLFFKIPPNSTIHEIFDSTTTTTTTTTTATYTTRRCSISPTFIKIDPGRSLSPYKKDVVSYLQAPSIIEQFAHTIYHIYSPAYLPTYLSALLS